MSYMYRDVNRLLQHILCRVTRRRDGSGANSRSSTVSGASYSRVPAAQVAVLALTGWLGLSADALACAVESYTAYVDRDLEVDYVSAPDSFLGRAEATDRAWGFLRCSGTYDLDIQVNLAGLTYVRNVTYQGLSYPAYELHPGSPLVLIHSFTWDHNVGGTTVNVPLSLGANTVRFTPRASSPYIDSFVRLFLVSRGGPTSSAAYRSLGTVSITPRQSPTLTGVIPISLGIQVRSPTCTLSDTDVSLDEVSADALRADGSSAAEKAFTVRMNCATAGANVRLQLADALDPGNAGSWLVATSDSTAGGVQLELMREGRPVQFGTAWLNGPSHAGVQNVSFSARYVRNALALQPGSIRGQATLSLDYD